VDSVTFGHQIIGPIGGYAEFFSEVSTENGSRWGGTVDLGVTYSLSKDIQFDAGINLGVTGAADDVNAFSGVTIRF
jgi:hypothetical protein